MKYTGQFSDINNNVYTVNIVTDNDSTTSKTITLGTSPFVTEIETSEEHIYKSCKYSTATIKILSEDYLFDLYSSKAQENKVTLIDYQGNVKWVGYTTPNLYSQGYENPIEEIEIECIDALSTLQYYQYKPLNGTTKEIVSILDIIDMLISKCNAYTTYYISNNTQFSSTANECLSSKLYISEQNFYDEDDEPMRLQDVMEEICRYLGVTAIADGESVYFLDYDAIKNGVNTYYQFAVGNTTGTLVTLSQTKTIEITDYAENGNQISLDNVYNKVTVKDSLYSFDSVISSIWDENDLSLYMKMDLSGNWHYYEEVEEEHSKLGKHKCFFKYYANPNYTSYYYDKNLNQYTYPLTVNYVITQGYVGATICRACFKKVESFDDIVNDVTFTDYLLLHTHDTNDTNVQKHLLADSDGNLYYDSVPVSGDNGVKLFELQVNKANPSFLGGENVYLLIQGTYIYMDRESEMYIPQSYSNKDDDFFEKNLWIKAKLEFGGKYWNGDSWQDTECCFKLPFDNNNQNDHCINQSFSTLNTVTYDMGIDEDGYAIPMPTENIYLGKPVFTLYSPHRLDSSYRCDAVWLKNFDIKAKIATYDIEVNKDSDTEYSNIIDDEFVSELDDEEFKICTWDNKECNYSAVAYYNGNNYSYLDSVYNKATEQTIRSEEQFIYKLVNQYSTPSTILNLNLKNNIKLYATVIDNFFQDKTFIVDNMITDYEYNKVEIKLIEKK